MKAPHLEEIRQARKDAGLTQAEAATLVCSPSYRTWNDWENGKRKMPIMAWELFKLKLWLKVNNLTPDI